MKVENKRILIAGASGDMGLALIPKLIDKENILGLHGNNSISRLKRFETDNTRLFKASLDFPREGIKLVEDYVEWGGGIDIFVQLTGAISKSVSWKEITPEDWNADISVNLTVPFFMARAAIARMSTNGKLVLTSTASASHGAGANTLAYGVAKSGVECVTKALAKFAGENNIMTNCICPGFIDTRMQKASGKTDQQILQRALTIPLGHPGTVEDIANLIYFLISDENRFINGQCLTIDGGDFI